MECVKRFWIGANRALYSDYKDNFALADLDLALNRHVGFRLLICFVFGLL